MNDTIFIVTVHAQSSVVCRASVDCDGGPGDDLGSMTIEQCCLNTPGSLAFSSGETCSACIGESTICMRMVEIIVAILS